MHVERAWVVGDAGCCAWRVYAGISLSESAPAFVLIVLRKRTSELLRGVVLLGRTRKGSGTRDFPSAKYFSFEPIQTNVQASSLLTPLSYPPCLLNSALLHDSFSHGAGASTCPSVRSIDGLLSNNATACHSQIPPRLSRTHSRSDRFLASFLPLFFSPVPLLSLSQSVPTSAALGQIWE